MFVNVTIVGVVSSHKIFDRADGSKFVNINVWTKGISKQDKNTQTWHSENIYIDVVASYNGYLKELADGVEICAVGQLDLRRYLNADGIRQQKFQVQASQIRFPNIKDGQLKKSPTFSNNQSPAGYGNGGTYERPVYERQNRNNELLTADELASHFRANQAVANQAEVEVDDESLPF